MDTHYSSLPGVEETNLIVVKLPKNECEPLEKTCFALNRRICGQVKNNCQQMVDCGTCPPPCTTAADQVLLRRTPLAVTPQNRTRVFHLEQDSDPIETKSKFTTEHLTIKDAVHRKFMDECPETISSKYKTLSIMDMQPRKLDPSMFLDVENATYPAGYSTEEVQVPPSMEDSFFECGMRGDILTMRCWGSNLVVQPGGIQVSRGGELVTSVMGRGDEEELAQINENSFLFANPPRDACFSGTLDWEGSSFTHKAKNIMVLGGQVNFPRYFQGLLASLCGSKHPLNLAAEVSKASGNKAKTSLEVGRLPKVRQTAVLKDLFGQLQRHSRTPPPVPKVVSVDPAPRKPDIRRKNEPPPPLDPPPVIKCGTPEYPWDDTPTLFVMRFEYVNLFHTTTELFAAYLTLQHAIDIGHFPKHTGMRPGTLRLVVLDGHAKGSMDDIWSIFFHTKLEYVAHLKRVSCLRKVAFSDVGYTAEINIHRNDLQGHANKCRLREMYDFVGRILHGANVDASIAPNPKRAVFIVRDVGEMPAHPRQNGNYQV